MEKPSLIRLFLIFMKISAIGFGGGYGILPLMREELVEKRKIMSTSDFYHAIAQAQSLPGPIAVNTSIFVGLKLFGILGAVILTFGVVVPPFFAILIIANLIDRFGNLEVFRNFLKGARIAIVVIIIDFAVRLSRRNLRDISSAVIIFIGVLLTFFLKIPVILAFLITAFFIYIVPHKKDIKSIRIDEK
ncbi:MAG: chromate transporter [Thermotogae bacterium]|nr:chromate transporter [Thermotogota bacterium]